MKRFNQSSSNTTQSFQVKSKDFEAVSISVNILNYKGAYGRFVVRLTMPYQLSMKMRELLCWLCLEYERFIPEQLKFISNPD